MNPEHEKWALFWCQLLRPIIFGDIEADGEHAFLTTLAKTAVVFPDARKVDDQVVAAAIEFKKDQPFRSDRVINFMLQKRFGVTLPKTTLYRHLKQAGATRLKPGVCNTKVRNRFSREHKPHLFRCAAQLPIF